MPAERAGAARVLVVNPGSSSLKLDLLGDGTEPLASTQLSASGWNFDEARVRDALRDFPDADVVGYRVVHGGSRYHGPAWVDDDLVSALEGMSSLAPLHERAAVRAIRVLRAVQRDLPGVACFDTAFHATLPPAAATYALPRGWRERFGLRRYGFHGLSHAYIARRVPELVGSGARRIVSCHLGSGASLAAIAGGISVDTTMGFTPLEGLVMGTRSGSVDPGLLLWLQREQGVSVRDLDRGLEQESGLLGLAGTSDMVEVLAGAAAGAPGAVLARDVYLHRLRREIAAMAAALGGIDVLSFTGGVGQHSPEIRRAAVEGLGFLGITIDEDRNEHAAPDAELTGQGGPGRVVVVAAREDLQVAEEARRLLAERRGG